MGKQFLHLTQGQEEAAPEILDFRGRNPAPRAVLVLSGLAILPGGRFQVSLQPTFVKPAYDARPGGCDDAVPSWRSSTEKIDHGQLPDRIRILPDPTKDAPVKMAWEG